MSLSVFMRAMESDMESTIHFTIKNRLRKVSYASLKPIRIAILHKEYILESLSIQRKSQTSLYTESMMIKYLFTFLETHAIERLEHFTSMHMDELFAFLATTPSKTGALLSQSAQRLVYTFFKNFAFWLSEYYPDEAPLLSLFQRSPFKRNNEHLKTAFISDHVLNQIKKGLKKEDDPLTRTYLLLCIYYGLRSQDIVSLREDCLRPSDKEGKFDLYYFDHKQKEQVILPAIASPVAHALKSLIQSHATQRALSKTPYIFLETAKNSTVRVLDAYQKNRLDQFVKRHDIRDESGTLTKLTSHMFRRTLATNMQSSGVSLEATQSILNHKHKRTTLKHYVKTKQTDYREQIAKTLDHMRILSSMQEVEIYHQGSEALRLSDGYCTNTAMLHDEGYMCETFPKRGNCYGCTKMVTTPEFLPYFQTLLEEKSREMDTLSHYGDHVTRHLRFETDMIGSIIKKLEELV